MFGIVLKKQQGSVVEYSKDGKHMTLRTPIPKEMLDKYRVSVKGDTITVEYSHREEKEEKHEHRSLRTSRECSGSFSQSTGRRIKSYDTKIEGENTLFVNVTFEDQSLEEKKKN